MTLFQRLRNAGLFLVIGVIGVIGLSCAGVAAASKIPVRTGSSYGPGDTGFNGCQSAILNLLNGNSASACEGFDPGTFTINGVQYSGGKFDFINGLGTDFGVLDILVLNINSTLSFSVGNFALPTGVFLCDKSTGTGILDSKNNPVGGNPPCTVGGDDGSFNSPDFTGLLSTFTLTDATFTTGDNAFVLFASDGNILGATFTPGEVVVATPEPGSLALLGLGIVAFWGRFRSRKQA